MKLLASYGGYLHKTHVGEFVISIFVLLSVRPIPLNDIFVTIAYL